MVKFQHSFIAQGQPRSQVFERRESKVNVNAREVHENAQVWRLNRHWMPAEKREQQETGIFLEVFLCNWVRQMEALHGVPNSSLYHVEFFGQITLKMWGAIVVNNQS
jgi:hypothetical protein